MPEYRSDAWKRLAQGRAERRRRKLSIGPHPLSHVDPDLCYQWMREDCASHDIARQTREDGLITTITQISSGALLAIPGLVFTSDSAVPTLRDEPLLYGGIGLFLCSLTLAMAEQMLSGKAYRRQKDIAQKYYMMESDRSSDSSFVVWLRRTRVATYFVFGFAIFISMISLMLL